MRAAAAFAALLTLAFPCSARAQVQLSMHDGLVSLNARDATVRQILAEWASVGQAQIVNAERIAGGQVTLQLVDVPELEALEIILRPVSGYIAAPRRTVAGNLSRFDRILITPTSNPINTPASRPAPAQQAFPVFQQFQQPADDDDDDQPAPNAPPPAPPLGQPRNVPVPNFPPQLVSPMQQQQLAQPGDPPAGESVPPAQYAPTPGPNSTFPPGVAVPGMVAQPPQSVPGGQPQQSRQP
jgi:hypothetical protein